VVNLGDGGSSDVWDLECRTVLDGMRAPSPTSSTTTAATTSGGPVAADADVAVVVVGYTYLDEGEYIGETDPSLAGLFPERRRARGRERFRRMLARCPSTEAERLADRPQVQPWAATAPACGC
jgi:hypothetical protein